MTASVVKIFYRVCRQRGNILRIGSPGARLEARYQGVYMLGRTAGFIVMAALLLPIAGACQTMSQPGAMSMPEAKTPAAPAAPAWPAVDGTVVLDSFRFGTGDTLPQLRLHYLTLGTPHRNAT